MAYLRGTRGASGGGANEGQVGVTCGGQGGVPTVCKEGLESWWEGGPVEGGP